MSDEQSVPTSFGIAHMARQMDRPIIISDRFPPTRWSLVLQAASPGNERDQLALSELLTRYQRALRSHLLMKKGLSPDRADDVVQGFLTDKVIAGGLIAKARKDRGKFRTLLLTAIDRYYIDLVLRERAEKRGGRPPVHLESDAEFAEDTIGPLDAFHVEWARGLLQQTLDDMKTECTREGRCDVWTVFDARVIGPLLRGEATVSYDALGRELGHISSSQASNLLITAKRMFIRCLRSTIGDYADHSTIDSELAELRAVLARSSASKRR